jgi:hypothetical protein
LKIFFEGGAKSMDPPRKTSSQRVVASDRRGLKPVPIACQMDPAAIGN